MDLTYANLLTLAGIHASIISIFVAAGIGYFLYLVGRRDELLSAIYEEAERVNTIWFGGLHSEDSYVAGDDTSREELMDRLMAIAGVASNADIPTDRKARGMEALRIITALGSYYPFPQTFDLTPEGTIIAGRTKQVEFKDINEVRKWISDANSLARTVGLLSTIYEETFLGLLSETTEDLARTTQATFSQRELGRFAASTMRAIVDSFFHNVESIQDIAASVKEKLVRWEIYKRRTTNRRLMIGFLLMNLVAFLAGVVYPITGLQIGLSVIIWVPFVIYALAFLYLAGQIIVKA